MPGIRVRDRSTADFTRKDMPCWPWVLEHRPEISVAEQLSAPVYTRPFSRYAHAKYETGSHLLRADFYNRYNSYGRNIAETKARCDGIRASLVASSGSPLEKRPATASPVFEASRGGSRVPCCCFVCPSPTPIRSFKRGLNRVSACDCRLRWIRCNARARSRRSAS